MPLTIKYSTAICDINPIFRNIVSTKPSRSRCTHPLENQRFPIIQDPALSILITFGTKYGCPAHDFPNSNKGPRVLVYSILQKSGQHYDFWLKLISENLVGNSVVHKFQLNMSPNYSDPQLPWYFITQQSCFRIIFPLTVSSPNNSYRLISQKSQLPAV